MQRSDAARYSSTASGRTAISPTGPRRSSRSSIRVALGESWMPAPTSSSFSARSKMETENPRRARHSAAVRPAMPAPAMATCREGAAMPAPLYAASGGGAGVVGHALGPRLVGAERGVVAIERRAIGADELVVLAHVEEHVWMVEGRRRAHAHEFLDP